ncbi:MAG: hypothetical protein HPM95_05185, partial [Alphaproteobacteria bacterium]|nr:hypothetical protein [Alphaproteobacteria bacterium]
MSVRLRPKRSGSSMRYRVTTMRQRRFAFARASIFDKALALRRTGEIDPGAKDEALFVDRARRRRRYARAGSSRRWSQSTRWEAAYTRRSLRGFRAERALFTELMAFRPARRADPCVFAERAVVAKIPEAGQATARPLHTVGIIGGGTMGSGIAVAALGSGLDVTLVERDDASAERAHAMVARLLDDGVRRGKMDASKRDGILAGLFRVATDYSALAEADLVIEAVFE